MKQLSILFLFCLLLAACSDDDKNEETILVTNIEVSDADKVFKPGETITITAQGFQENDRFMVDIRWPLDDPSGLIKEGSSLSNAIIKEQTSESITFLVPGHNPAATLKLLLIRGSQWMTLCKVSVADGQAPKELQLYGITNSNFPSNHPRGIQHIDLTTGKATDVATFAQGEDFSLVGNVPGNYNLCGLMKQDGEISTGNFDLSMRYWKSHAIPNFLTFCTSADNIFAIAQADEQSLTIYEVNTFYLTRLNMPQPSKPRLPMPQGFKPQSLCRYTGVLVSSSSSMLFSADNGDGTFSPVVFDLRSEKFAIHVFDPIQADALIPFSITVPKQAPNSEYTTVCAFAVVSQNHPNSNGTELRLWNSITNTMEEPFATFPNAARSIAPHYSEDLKTIELYALFNATQSEGIIQIYDVLKKEWRPFPGFNFPYSEIVFAR